MATSSPALENPETTKQSSARPETLLRDIASMLLLVYGVGFLIIAVYEAQYGIAQFNPLRTKALLVGFVFCCFVILPAAAFHYGNHYLGWEWLKKINAMNDPRIEIHQKIIRLCIFAYTCSLMTYAFIWVFIPEELPRPWWYGVAWVVCLAFYPLVFHFVVASLAEQPIRCSVLAILTTVLFLIGTYYFQAEPSRTLTIWFLLVGLLAYLFRSSKNKLRVALDYNNWLFFAFSIIGFYVLQIYGRIPPHFGGGAPNPIVMSVSKPVGGITSNTITVRLIDENEEGFYILLPGKTKALYIPRSNVESVYYSSSK